MINFEHIRFKLNILSPEDQIRSNNPSVAIQYFHFDNQAWVSIYEEIILNNQLDLLKAFSEVDATNHVEMYFFEMIRNGYIPPVRIIPGSNTLPPKGVDKQIVGSNMYSFQLNPTSPIYEFDFGSLWVASEEMISEVHDLFPDFIPVTTFFQPNNSKTETTTPVPINELYTDIVSEIENADKLSRSSAFKLSNISLKLKAVIHRDGEAMSASLLDLTNSENINGNAISELVFDIAPVQTGEKTAESMPNLIGLTETAVRRILKKQDLRLNPVYENNSNIVNGDSFKQSPAEGALIQPNQLITVIFSKHE